MKTKVALAFLLMILGTTSFAAVGMSTHRDGEERSCMDCHRHRNIHTNEGVLSSKGFCYECHAKEECRRLVDGTSVSLQVSEKAFERTRHRNTACIHCHTDVARSPHKSDAGVQCRGCHAVHGEGTTGDPHLRVRCEACHVAGSFVRLDPDSDRVALARQDDKGSPLSYSAHAMTETYDKAFCQRCHTSGNTVGAAAMVLPSKSFLCLVCHPSPARVGHPMFWIALCILAAGLILMVSLWFRGKVGDEESSTHRKAALLSESVWSTLFSRRLFTVLGALFFDVLMQRRLLKESVRRWSIHSLIFLAFVGRFLLSLTTVLLHNLVPDSRWAMALLDKNHWFTAAANDLLGLFILAGVIWAASLRFILRPKHVLSEEQDTLALAIIGLLTAAGFALEGARILVTNLPQDIAAASFVGFAISRLWSLLGSDWQTAYGILWYVHAALWVAFIAYLPFGKLKHVITTPLTLIIRRLNEETS